VPAVLSA